MKILFASKNLLIRDSISEWLFAVRISYEGVVAVEVGVGIIEVGLF